MMHYGASPFLFARARQLRDNETRAEKLLWARLSNKQLGVKFRRQHPLHRFIVDFYCHELKLVIEVDGGIHFSEENQEYDQMRTELIAEFEIKVIRFRNEEIYYEIENVIDLINKFIPH
ncbi:endonuclease domain-containing protein [Dyadobacter sp. LJ53]|uniref:endonuclease domain-containing protein n=1 Tax=Dyadobacter chenwenxiniae TaxID=2906456 RepID=UPI001F287211|nr:endonuclease domain-containing protein [Dyadobacter chenwenxiniae]MCF0050965.1 endonuclease domain-containing protein [Dyadobacter chenwenxiniae]